MAFTKKIDTSFPTPWAPTKKGEAIEGIYVGMEQVPRKAADGGGHFASYTIKPAGSDKLFGVSGAMLERAFLQIPKGAPVQVTYEGEKKLNNGRRAKDFSVAVDDSVKLLETNPAFDPNTGELRG